MSLRGFHIFFICLVTLASFGIAAIVYLQGYGASFWGACAAFGFAAATYGLWFVRKSRNLIL